MDNETLKQKLLKVVERTKETEQERHAFRKSVCSDCSEFDPGGKKPSCRKKKQCCGDYIKKWSKCPLGKWKQPVVEVVSEEPEIKLLPLPEDDCCGEPERTEEYVEDMTGLRGFTQLDTELSDRCNFGCEFCYTRGGHALGPDMDRTKAFVGWFIRQLPPPKAPKRPAGKVVLFGGEPTYEWDELLRLHDWIAARADGQIDAGTSVAMGIVTNMSLMTAPHLDELRSRHISISPSVDGCAQAQDAHRRFKNGTGSSEIVFKNTKLFVHKRGRGSHCRTTVTPVTAPYLFESVRFLCEELGFSQVNPVLAGGVEWSDRDIEVVKEQTALITDWWIKNMLAGKHYSIFYMRNLLIGVGGSPKGSLCPSGVSRCGIDTKGNIWPCHRFCNFGSSSMFYLGNVKTGRINGELTRAVHGCNRMTVLENTCKGCRAFAGCHRFCMHELMQRNQIWLEDGKLAFTPQQHLCKLWPFYWDEAVRADKKLRENDCNLYLENYDNKTKIARKRERILRDKQKKKQS